MKRLALAIAALAALTLTLTASATETPVTCDVFIHRLKQAESALGIPMPRPDHDFADMRENIMGKLISGAAYVNTQVKEDDQDATLTCEKEGNKLFDEFQLNVPPNHNNKLSNVRTANLIAAALYAYTGWPSKKIFAAQRKLVDDWVRKTRLNLIRGEDADDVELTLPGNGVARLYGGDGGMTLVVTARDNDPSESGL